MRMVFGLILGGAITVGGAYLADTMSATQDSRPMVNWDVVAQNVDNVMVLARHSWKKIAG